MDAVKITTTDLLASSRAYQRKTLLGVLSAWSEKTAGSPGSGFEVPREQLEHFFRWFRWFLQKSQSSYLFEYVTRKAPYRFLARPNMF